MEMLWDVLKVAAVVVAVGLVAFGCVRALKASDRKEGEGLPERSEPMAAPAAREAVSTAASVREYVPGPALTRRDDAFYAVVSAAIAEALAAEGINPEGGFEITSVKTVNDPAAPKLTVKDSVLYAAIAAAISETLSAEGVNPEGGFAIQSVKAL